MKILLVDDDQSVIQSLLAMLRSLPGHEVRVATNAEKALENAAALGGVDLLISDVVMEPTNGFALRAAMVERYPQIRTIFISGFDLSDYPDELRGVQLLAKPIELDALRAALDAEVAALRQAAAPKVPVARPAAVALPTPVAAPAVATAAPRVVAATEPKARVTVAAPVAVTIPKAAPAAPAATPAVRVAATPVAAVRVPMAAPVSAGGDGLIGQTIGAYRILHKVGEGRWGNVYAAVQIAINRPVGLKILDPAQAADEASKARFMADARAKAHVQHPSILSVYEAGESSGHIFYAHEYVEGQNLAELAAANQKLPEPAAMKIIRTVGEGMNYLHAQNIPHTALASSSIYVGADGGPRLTNLATQLADQQSTMAEEIVALGRAMFAVIHTGPNFSPGLRSLLSRIVQAPGSGLDTWTKVLQELQELAPKVVPSAVAHIGAQDRATAAVVHAVRKQQKKGVILNIISMLALVGLAAWAVWHFVIRTREHVIDEMIAIPAGTYTVGTQKVKLPEFWIDKHEVTIGQYARFLDYLEKNPGTSKDFDHPRQPKFIAHEPPNWGIFFPRAQSGKPVHSAPYSLDSPVVEVSWWDAYAYAKWRGRELPSEEQWEAAARGAEGSIYPWGNDMDVKKVNSGADFNGNNPAAEGAQDGWNFWSPVDRVGGDKSAFGVVGLAGNVSEWVSSWTPDSRFPLIKGGNYMSADVRLDKRVADHDPSKGEEHIGFRTVSKTPPEK